MNKKPFWNTAKDVKSQPMSQSKTVQQQADNDDVVKPNAYDRMMMGI